MTDQTSTSSPQRVATVWMFALLVFIVFAWALNWVVMKVAVQELSPLWAVAIRTVIAVAVLVPGVALSGQLTFPARGDMPVVLVISLFHMTAFAGAG